MKVLFDNGIRFYSMENTTFGYNHNLCSSTGKNNNKKTLYCFSYLMENDDEANVYIDLFLNLMKRVEMLAEDQTASISQGGPRTPQ